MSSFPAWRIFIAAMLFFVIADLIFLDWVFLNDRPSASSSSAISQIDQQQLTQMVNQIVSDQKSDASSSQSGECTLLCRRYLDTQLKSAVASISGTTKVEKVVEKTTTIPSTNPATTGTFYVPIGGSGNTTNRTWTDTTAEVIVNWDNYQGDKITVSWEGYVKLKDGNGLASARLFDVTHQVAVPGSELETSYWDFKYIASGPLTVWSGNITYRVQIKSLTGYQTSYEGGKIKIVIE